MKNARVTVYLRRDSGFRVITEFLDDEEVAIEFSVYEGKLSTALADLIVVHWELGNLIKELTADNGKATEAVSG